ncbi:MAG: ATP-binding protein [Armatimonadetes bacterium]|nr:ATP-binding protein [Armatimonadota bacterium]
MNLILDRLHQALLTLQLGEVDALLESPLEQAAQQERTYADFLCPLLEAEVDARRTRALLARTRMAGLPYAKSLAQFDFAFQPRLDERQIRELATLRFVADASNIIFLGPPGVGQTHLAVALALEALQGGHSVIFTTAHQWVADLGRAAREGSLEPRLRHYLKPKVLVIDEVGSLPLDSVGATTFFQWISARYERGSVLLTSNKSYADWGQVFGEVTLATAILDRLLHHSTTLNIRGESYRLKERRKAGLLAPERKEGTPVS